MAELVDAYGSGPYEKNFHAGSNPVIRTNLEPRYTFRVRGRFLFKFIFNVAVFKLLIIIHNIARKPLEI